MKRWEYLEVKLAGWPFIQQLNELGDQGWELVQIHFPGTLGAVAYFKREIP